MAERQARAFDYAAAREAVSEELGHYRGEVVGTACDLSAPRICTPPRGLAEARDF